MTDEEFPDRLERRTYFISNGLAVLVALFSTACLILHMIIVFRDLGFHSLAMLALSLACLGCAWHGVFHPGLPSWASMLVATVSMIVVHLTGHMSSGHHSGATVSMSASFGAERVDGLMETALLLTSVELLLGMIALFALGIGQRVREDGQIRPASSSNRK